MADDRVMKQLSAAIGETLVREVSCYLAVVEVFRAERCEPTWRQEGSPPSSVRLRGPSQRSGGRQSRASRP